MEIMKLPLQKVPASNIARAFCTRREMRVMKIHHHSEL